MTRCTCGYDGDPTVFGECRTCAPEPESVHAPTIQAELDRLERPYETTLRDPYDMDDDERSGR